MSAWLITGGAGFIGSNFVRAVAADAPAPIVVLDALTYSGNLASIAELIEARRIQFVHADIRDPDTLTELFARHDFQRVVHFAAESHVDRSILGPRAFVETNVVGTLNLLAAARDRWQGNFAQRLFLHISTDEVFGTLAATEPPFNESTPYAPNSPYAASKAASDHLVRAWHHTYGFPAIITNCSNNYGPWQFPEKLIPLMILNAIEGRELPVYGDGLQVRDWLHVADHCDALRVVLERGTVGATYCIGGGQQHTNLQVVSSICDLVSERLGQAPRAARRLIRHVEDRPGHDRRYAIDSGKVRRELGWSPRFDLMASLPELVDWYLAHADWVAGIRSGDYLRFYEQQYSHRLRKTS
ncbi:MAG TPA: dTDP-glucose 4,6-dehydratase [Steroidobacteraceae bacterium]|jgi:dTDP-glucose 4,6-dehydratase